VIPDSSGHPPLPRGVAEAVIEISPRNSHLSVIIHSRPPRATHPPSVLENAVLVAYSGTTGAKLLAAQVIPLQFCATNDRARFPREVA
jgi:hypothetical protein